MIRPNEIRDAPFLWIGVDVAKKTFTAAAKSLPDDAVRYPQGQDFFENNRAGARKLCAWIRELQGKLEFSAAVAMEETGEFSHRLYDNLKKVVPNLHISICNSLAVSYFMKSVSANKTDRADAAVIARYAAAMNPAPYREPSRDEAELKRLSRDRNFLVGERTSLANRLASQKAQDSRSTLRNVIAAFDKEIAKIDAKIKNYLSSEASAECREEIRLMQTVPGVGLLSAAIIYGELGPLSAYTRKELSAMSGVCPTTQQSGTSLHKGGLSKKGSAELRRILYLDSQQTIAQSKAMKEFHERMLSKPNSSKMSARVACMRKLLLVLRGIVVSGKDFDPNHVSKKPNFKKEGENLQKSEKSA